MASMTKEKLADLIEKAIGGVVEEFISQKSPEAIEAQKQFDALEDQKRAAAKALGVESAAYKGALKEIEREQKALDTGDAKGDKNNRIHAALAFVHAANNMRIPITLKKTKAKGNEVNNGRTRRPAAQRERDRAAILKVMTKSRQTTEAIAKKVKSEIDMVRGDLEADSETGRLYLLSMRCKIASWKVS